jgi:hypothetical protein
VRRSSHLTLEGHTSEDPGESESSMERVTRVLRRGAMSASTLPMRIEWHGRETWADMESVAYVGIELMGCMNCQRNISTAEPGLHQGLYSVVVGYKYQCW